MIGFLIYLALIFLLTTIITPICSSTIDVFWKDILIGIIVGIVSIVGYLKGKDVF
jgi:hypothetical protein